MTWKELLLKARQEVSAADYTLKVTAGASRDKSVLINLLVHADNAVSLGMDAFLTRERELKNRRILPATEELRRQVFFSEYKLQLGITSEEKLILSELNEIAQAHKKNQLELKRGDEVIIILNNYKTVVVNEHSITKYLSLAKGFISKLESMSTSVV